MASHSVIKFECGGFLGLLTIVFITLKLTGHIDWSWWLVLAAVWVPMAFVAGMFLLCLAAFVISEWRNY